MNKTYIGVFGGSGFHTLFDEFETIELETPYGKPSAKLTIGKISKKSVVFLPRHGTKHEFPPHKIPWRANLWAFKELGVKRILGPCAAGSLQSTVKPGSFVICDQFVDFTKTRPYTFYDGPVTTHISSADPYCEELRQIAINCCKKLGIEVHSSGTVVVIEGPRFTSKAESYWFTQQGWEVINMTQIPEAVLARELELCYANISLITDYDAGLVAAEHIKPVTADQIVKIFETNNEKLKNLIYEMIKLITKKRECNCKNALRGAQL
jgi:5'-methylthioadenosine phosphorylase